MAEFLAESPVLGPGFLLQELSGYGTATPIAAAYKPGSRVIISATISAVQHTAVQTAWIYEAPWACKVLAVRFNCTVISSDTTPPTLDVLKATADSVDPASGTSILAATLNLHTIVANTRQELALTATKSVLLLNAGDQLGFSIGGHAATALAGGGLQIELAQIG